MREFFSLATALSKQHLGPSPYYETMSGQLAMNDRSQTPAIPEPPISNVQAFKLLFSMENVLREFIIEQLGQQCGPKWHKTRLPADIYQKYVESKQYELRVKWVALVPHHPIYYVDFADLRKIIEQKNNWNELFQMIFRQKNIVSDSLFSIEPIRNTVAHNRLLSPSDLLQLHGCQQRLQTLVGVDNFNRLLRGTNCYVSLPAQLDLLLNELLSTYEAIREFHLIVAIPHFEKCLSSWWFDCDYLGKPIDGIEQYHLALLEYMRLPRGWGTGLALERWAKSAMFCATFERAKKQMSELNLSVGTIVT